jgi:hypothetical protein
MKLGPRLSALIVLTMCVPFLCFRKTSIALQAREGVVVTYTPETRDWFVNFAHLNVLCCNAGKYLFISQDGVSFRYVWTYRTLTTWILTSMFHKLSKPFPATKTVYFNRSCLSVLVCLNSIKEQRIGISCVSVHPQVSIFNYWTVGSKIWH